MTSQEAFRCHWPPSELITLSRRRTSSAHTHIFAVTRELILTRLNCGMPRLPGMNNALDFVIPTLACLRVLRFSGLSFKLTLFEGG